MTLLVKKSALTLTKNVLRCDKALIRQAFRPIAELPEKIKYGELMFLDPRQTFILHLIPQKLIRFLCDFAAALLCINDPELVLTHPDALIAFYFSRGSRACKQNLNSQVY